MHVHPNMYVTHVYVPYLCVPIHICMAIHMCAPMHMSVCHSYVCLYTCVLMHMCICHICVHLYICVRAIHMCMEAEKSHGLLSATWRTKKAGSIIWS